MIDALPVELRAEDGVLLHAVHRPPSPGAVPGLAVVFGHGFTGSTRKPAVRRVLTALSAYAGVVAIDFRGHGRSGGVSTLGAAEVLDIEAAVQWARGQGYPHVVTVGASMGGHRLHRDFRHVWHHPYVSVLTSRPVHLLGGAVTVLFLAAAVTAAARAGIPALVTAAAGVQAVLIVGWLIASDPPSPRAVAAVAIGTAAVADVLAVVTARPSLAPLAGVLGLSVLATIVVQLARGVARARVTEAMASTLGLTAAVASMAALLVLRRQHGGLEVVTAAAIAGGVGLMTARFVDFVLPVPHLAAGVAHGGLGIVIGSMTGTAAGAFFAAVPSLTPHASAFFAWSIALVAVLADLAAAYAMASVPERPRYSFMAGPLMALVATVPIAYVLASLLVTP